MVQGNIKIKTEQILKNIKAIAEEAGADLSRVIKTTVFLVDLSNFKYVNEVYASYFQGILPARSAVQVAALPLNADIEIEAIISIA